MNWMPLASKISSFETTLQVFSGTPCVARVAIVVRIIDQRAIFTEECNVDAPRVDADRIDLQFALTPGDGQAATDLVEEAQRVPIKAGRELHRRIGEAVQFFERQHALFELTQHDAATGGSEVDRKSFHLISTITLPTPSV